MDIDNDKIDEAVLALLSLTLHDDVRAWKSFDWEAMNRLFEKGYILNPVGKAKSVVLTEKGLGSPNGCSRSYSRRSSGPKLQPSRFNLARLSAFASVPPSLSSPCPIA